MSDILDEPLDREPGKTNISLLISVLLVAAFALGVLFKILHWKYNDVILLSGAILSLGYQLGFMSVLRFNDYVNNFFFALNITLMILARRVIWRIVGPDWYIYAAGVLITAMIIRWYQLQKSR